VLPAYDVTINFDDVECLKVKPCERAQNRREKFSRERVRQLVEHLRGTNTPHSVAIQIDSFCGQFARGVA
jgi:hypothetical protein